MMPHMMTVPFGPSQNAPMPGDTVAVQFTGYVRSVRVDPLLPQQYAMMVDMEVVAPAEVVEGPKGMESYNPLGPFVAQQGGGRVDT